MIYLKVLFLLVILKTSFVNTSCPTNFFDCGNGRCIADFWRCDGEDDCGNWADEHSCHDLEMRPTVTQCPLNHSHCNDSHNTCVPNKWICDGMEDCSNGWDEKNCDIASAKCDGFLCEDFGCIPLRWKCDGIPDCDDGSDESKCPKPKPTKICDKEHGYYQCLTGECISHTKVCDNHKDCPQGDDEGIECRPNGCHTIKCSQMCFIAPEGPRCYCRKGFTIDKDNTTCIDENECLQNKVNGLCSQSCVNLDGGYKCGCFEDYQLVNNKSCVVKDGEPLLLFTNSEGIRGLWLRSGRYFPIHHSLRKTVGIDYLGSEERVFWVDLDKSLSGVYSVDISGEEFEPIVTNGLKSPEDLAIDWIGRNIYITDSELNAIVVCSLEGGICASNLWRKVDLPRGIVVNPLKGMLYWTEWGKNPGIYESGMDGTKQQHLISTEVVWPNGLALDVLTDRLYWTEAKIGKIEFFDLETKQRKTVIEDKVFHPFSLAVFEDWIYWSDFVTYSLDMGHKFTGHNQTTLLREMNEHIMGVHVFHPLSQKSAYNPCWSHLCSHMCVLGPLKSYSCVCPEHLVLSKDDKTCVEKSDNPFLLLGVGQEVFKLYSEAIGNDVMIDIEIPKGLRVGDIAYDWKTKTLFIFDAKKLVIGSLNFEKTFSNWIPLITERLDRVEGLTYDSHTNNLYWIESKEGILEVSTADGKSRALVMKDLDKPIDLALHPEHRRMYVAIMGDKPHILVADMDGQNRKVLIASKNGFPISLSIDNINEKLFWADPKNGIIEWLDLFVPKEHESRKGVVKRNIGHVMSIAVHNKSLFWTDMDSDVINHETIDSSQTVRHSKFTINVKHRGKSEKKLLIASPEHTPISPCLHLKGGCGHICLLGRYGPTCKCSFGYELQSDGQSCEKNSEMKDNSVLCVDCVTKDLEDSEESDIGFIPFENSVEDDLNWFMGNEDEEVDRIFREFDNQYKGSDHSVNMTTHTGAKVSEEDLKQHLINNSKNRQKDKTHEKHIKSEVKSKNNTKNVIQLSKIGSEAKSEPNTNSRNGWLTLFVAVVVVIAVVLIVFIIIKKDNYSEVRNVLYRRGDQLKGAFINFQNPMFRSIPKTDEEEPLNDDETKSLCEDRY